MRIIISQILRMPLDGMYRIQIPYAGMSRISVTRGDARAYPQLVFHSGSRYDPYLFQSSPAKECYLCILHNNCASSSYWRIYHLNEDI